MLSSSTRRSRLFVKYYSRKKALFSSFLSRASAAIMGKKEEWKKEKKMSC